MKVLFEGTEEQFKNLEHWLNLSPIILPKMRKDVSTDTIWQVDDVKHRWDCTDEEALSVLSSAMENEATMNQCWESIDFHAEDMGLTKKGK